MIRRKRALFPVSALFLRLRAILPSGRGTWPALWMLPDLEKYGCDF